MAVQSVDGAEAWTRLARAPYGQWTDAAARIADDPFVIHHAPRFTLSPSARYFCIGSCFARNIEEHLIYRGVDVLSKRVVSPKAEWGARANGFLNKFTTQSMLQELRWLDHPPMDWADTLTETANGWRDLQLAPELGETSLERALERRKYLAEDYFQRIRHADVVLMTLGLNEVWRDTKLDLHLNAAPPLWNARKEPGRYRLEITDVESNTAALDEIYARLKAINHNIKIIVTVSPVPMRATFSGRDVGLANTLSKSTLRASAEHFVQTNNDTDYFPSYEIVSLSKREFAFGPDYMHVSNQIVGQAMSMFMKIYCPSAPEAPEGFVELNYLDANPDVEDRIRSGELTSGFEHWVREGKSQGRPLGLSSPSGRAQRAGI